MKGGFLMAKIIDNDNNIVIEDEYQTVAGIVCDYLESNNYHCEVWNTIPQLIETLTGNSITPFNTIGEMIQRIPDIINCGAEDSVICVFSKTLDYYIISFGKDEDENLLNSILSKYFPNLRCEA